MTRWVMRSWACLALMGFLNLTVVHADRLIVSNYPEELSEPGRLVDTTLPAGLTRLMYYHLSRASLPMTIQPTLVNRGDVTVSIQWRHGLGGPSEDGIFAGHRSARLYWDKHVADQWARLTLPPGQPVVLPPHAFRPQMVSTGLLEFKTAQPDISFWLDVIDPAFPMMSALHRPRTPYRFGMFDQSVETQTVMVDFSIPIQEIPIGGTRFLYDPQSSIVLRGNYGMIYDIVATLKNPGPTPGSVSLYLAPLGGINRGVVVLDQRIIETTFIHHKNKLYPEHLQRVVLQPHETRQVRIRTLPQGGCFYPANLVLVAAQPPAP